MRSYYFSHLQRRK
ncbi:hypothetical protein LINPERPRIM_LOCUS18787 [Linum perenne]